MNILSVILSLALIVPVSAVETVRQPFAPQDVELLPSRYNDYYTFDYQIPFNLDDCLSGAASLEPLGPLSFRTSGGVPVIPLYDAQHVRYAVYWRR